MDQAAHFYLKRQAEVKTWIENSLERRLEFEDLYYSLRDGVILCELINYYRPNSVRVIHRDTDPYNMMRNINNFLTAAARLIGKKAPFEVSDLFERVDMFKVVEGLRTLSGQTSRSASSSLATPPKILSLATPQFPKPSPSLVRVTARKLRDQQEHQEYRSTGSERVETLKQEARRQSVSLSKKAGGRQRRSQVVETSSDALGFLLEQSKNGIIEMHAMWMESGRELVVLHMDIRELIIRAVVASNGKLLYEMPLKDLRMIDPLFKELNTVRLHWQIGKLWELEFVTPQQRELFVYTMRVLHWHCQDGTVQSVTGKLSVCVGSWNLGNAPPPQSLQEWLHAGKHDIYVVGVQECEYTPRAGYATCEDDWFTTVTNHIGPEYESIIKYSLWQMRLIVFVRRRLMHAVSNVEFGAKATGVAGVVANKGGIGASFHFFNTRLCFVSCHLAAHQAQIQARNDNITDIINGVRLGTFDQDITEQFHHIFWLGDLNYRIELERQEVVTMATARHTIIENGSALPEEKRQQLEEVACDYERKLMENDQLKQQMADGRILSGFIDCPISFPPTYKYDRVYPRVYGTERNRIPAYCDRILYKSLPGCSITNTFFRDAPTIVTSDHSPVSAGFEFKPWVSLSSPETHLDQAATMFAHLSDPDALPRHSKLDYTCQIVITNLAASNLDNPQPGAIPEPYVIFSAPFMEERAKTKTASKAINPQWPDKAVPPVISFVNDQQYMDNSHIFIRVFHRQTFSDDIPLGHGVISLKGASEVAVPFVTQLSLLGKSKGELRGMVRIFSHHHV